MKKPSLKAIDKRIEQIYYKTCSGVQIDVMDIGRVFAVGRQAAAEGASDETLASALVAFVNSIRKDN